MKELSTEPCMSSRDNLYAFVMRLIVFLLSITVAVVILFFSSRYLSRESLIIDDGISILVCGDSHTMSAVNDSVLSSSMNISNTSQPFFYTYSVLVPLLARNPQIQTVLLGYSFHSVSSIMDDILFNSDLAKNNCVRRNNYLAVADLSYVVQLVRTDGIQILVLVSLKQIWKSLHPEGIHDVMFIGKYYPSTGQNLTDENVEAAIQRHYYYESGLVRYGIAEYQINYLYKIAELCNQNEIELFLVNTPVSTQYYEAIPQNYIDNFYYIASTVDATLLDFHDSSLPDSCYGNADHLNYYGAAEFSLLLDSILDHRLSTH